MIFSWPRNQSVFERCSDGNSGMALCPDPRGSGCCVHRSSACHPTIAAMRICGSKSALPYRDGHLGEGCFRDHQSSLPADCGWKARVTRSRVLYPSFSRGLIHQFLVRISCLPPKITILVRVDIDGRSADASTVIKQNALNRWNLCVRSRSLAEQQNT